MRTEKSKKSKTGKPKKTVYPVIIKTTGKPYFKDFPVKPECGGETLIFSYPRAAGKPVY